MAIASCGSCARSKRSASITSPDLTGIVNVNKPKGWTSHDVVGKVRTLAGQKRVGHAGTLDPMAEGVLPVLLGRATRLADYIQAGHKTYVATVQLGVATDSDDADGRVTSRTEVPRLSRSRVDEALASFRGEILQTPPRYSALKVAGRRAYALARAGGDVDLAPRPVTIHDARLITLEETHLSLEVTCSKGTYLRALARDLAVVLGTVGHLSALVRTRVGPFCIDEALSIEEISARGVASVLQSASRAIPDAPRVSVALNDAARLANGQPIPLDNLRAESVWVYDPHGLLVCLASADGAMVRPRLVL